MLARPGQLSVAGSARAPSSSAPRTAIFGPAASFEPGRWHEHRLTCGKMLPKKTNVRFDGGFGVRNPLAAHPPWRQLLIISVVLPLMIALAVLTFTWPVARIAPRDLPVGVVGTNPASEQAVTALTDAKPGAFSFQLYPDKASAESAIRARDVYGAFAFSHRRVTVLEASAASPAVAQLLGSVGQQFAQHATEQAEASGEWWLHVRLTQVDVVPTVANDPRELALALEFVPLSISSLIMAAVIALLLGFRPAWRQFIALAVVSAAAGLGAFLIAQGFLGVLPHRHLATWGALSLTVFAMGTTTAGLVALVGAAGLGLSAALMVFVGNAFSGNTSAPQLLPAAVDHIGQWFPSGAAANLLRSTAYFNGNGASGHLCVLIAWSVFGLALIILGHHAPARFPAQRLRGPAGSHAMPPASGSRKPVDRGRPAYRGEPDEPSKPDDRGTDSLFNRGKADDRETDFLFVGKHHHAGSAEHSF